MKLSKLLLTIVLVFPRIDAQAGMAPQQLVEACDSIKSYLKERSSVKSEVKLRKVLTRGKNLDLYFGRSLSQFPIRKDDVRWMRSFLTDAVKDNGELGEIFANGVKLEELVTPETGNNGLAPSYAFRVEDPKESFPFIEEIGAVKPSKGLYGRYIALWQSHGRYYNENEDRWMWQRAPVNRTVEDLYTQSYVLPFLIPMLENAGAFVMTPRERDTNTEEVICDRESEGMTSRTTGRCTEKGKWTDAGAGFADTKETLLPAENPFAAGLVRKADCTASSKPTAITVWKPEFKKNWKGAVYISYKTLPESSSCAVYKVSHRGGESRFIVDQKRGGGTWIYLGTFEMDGNSSVELNNATPKGRQFRKGSVITADAVRFGGGIGKVERGGSTSGFPAYCEGAIYNMLWSGIDKEVYTEHDSEYVNDFASRGPWVKYLKDKKDIPFDLSLAFHTDAGVTQADSTVGTLAIYTLKCEGSRKMSDGKDRMTGRALAEMVQDQVIKDIRSGFDPTWSRRFILDKSYSECRTSDVPAMILELLSHQNFTDMTYGLDPAFRFAVSRSVYKGILKFLSALYGCAYTVQPLPVNSFEAVLGTDGKATLRWEATEDSAEPTAVPVSYLVYTRTDGGAWDKGTKVKDNTIVLTVPEGRIQSYKVVAVNAGGRSFPSEILSVGRPAASKGTALIVNAFTSVRAPYSFEAGTYAGFDGREDSGVPYIEDLSYIGESYNYNRNDVWETDCDPGFGASYTNFAGSRIAGNTFDYPYVHGRALMELGFAFCSKSAASFTGLEDCSLIDIIAGKEKDIFRNGLLESIANTEGRNIILSGSETGFAEKKDTSGFIRKRFGFRWQSSHASPDGTIDNNIKIWNRPNELSYCVENPDALRPSGPQAKTLLHYTATDFGACVANDGRMGRSVVFGFPLEAVVNREDMVKFLSMAINFFEL